MSGGIKPGLVQRMQVPHRSVLQPFLIAPQLKEPREPAHLLRPVALGVVHEVPDVEEAFGQLVEVVLGAGFVAQHEAVADELAELGAHHFALQARSRSDLTGAHAVPLHGQGMHDLLLLRAQLVHAVLVERRHQVQRATQVLEYAGVAILVEDLQ